MSAQNSAGFGSQNPLPPRTVSYGRSVHVKHTYGNAARVNKKLPIPPQFGKS